MIVKLDDVVNRITGNVDRFNTDLQYYVGGEHYDCGCIAIYNKGILDSEKGTLLGFKFHFPFEKGDTLFMARNPHLKKAGMVTYDGICSDASYVLRTKDSSVLAQEYLPIIIQNDLFWQFFEANKSGSVNYLMNWKEMKKYEFELPPLERQEKVSKMVWAAEKCRRSYLDLVRVTDELVKSQFIEMFEDNQKKPLCELAKVVMGQSPLSKYYNNEGEGLPFYQGKTEFGDVFINKPVTWCTEPTRFANANDVLMSVRAPVGSVNIATEACCIGRGMAAITPNEGKATTLYLFYALKVMETEIERMGVGSTFKAINKQQVFNLLLPEAEKEEQDLFVEFAKQTDKSKFELQQSIVKVDNLIKSLIQGSEN